jgi:thiamine monophosphate synthase
MPLYKLSQDAVIEEFDDGALVLILRSRRLVELSQSAIAIVSLLDGKRTLEQIAAEIANNHDISHDYPVTLIIQDVLELCMDLNQTGVLELGSED